MEPVQPVSSKSRLSLIKIVAAVLFITLPFAGFWLGMEHQRFASGTKYYVAPSIMCLVINYRCSDGSKGFANAIGCGCEISTSALPIIISPTPTPDETVRWKIYKSPHGFSFQYPEEPVIDYSFYDGSYLDMRSKASVFDTDGSEDINFWLRIEQHNYSKSNTLSEMIKLYSKEKVVYAQTPEEIYEEIMNSSKPYNNNHIQGLAEESTIYTKHNEQLYIFNLLSSSHEADTIFHTIVSTFSFIEIDDQTPAYYENELISLSYPANWRIALTREDEPNFSIIVEGGDNFNNSFRFNPNGIVPEGVTFEDHTEATLIVPTTYGGTKYTGYGDFSVERAKKEQVLIDGLPGTKHVYYQRPVNPAVGAISWVFIPVGNGKFYTLEYSGGDKESLDVILESISFKKRVN
ncbi:hypothetical protein HY468_04225 [Candidatus Roizmanbacteria bacterium]|nr:hypothetical protein [Candidatus Roizmanbacteria bacterium]